MIPQQATRTGLIKRRTFLKATLGVSAVGLAASAGLLTPTRVWAAEWPKNAFDAKSIADALKDLYGASASTASGSIKIKAPIQAENGAVVPIAVSANLPNVQGLAVFVEKNAQPLVASVVLTGAAGYFSRAHEDGPDLGRARGVQGRRQALQRQADHQGHRRRLRRVIETG